MRLSWILRAVVFLTLSAAGVWVLSKVLPSAARAPESGLARATTAPDPSRLAMKPSRRPRAGELGGPPGDSLSMVQQANSRWVTADGVPLEASAGAAPGEIGPGRSSAPSGAVKMPPIDWVTLPGGTYLMDYREGLGDTISVGSKLRYVDRFGRPRVEEIDEEKFKLASTEYSRSPGRPVTVGGFQLARTEVTNAQYGACVAAGACTAVPSWCKDQAFGGPDQPVVCVSWDQAKAFSEWVGGRLPTSEEWEYACRSAGKKWAFPWGDLPLPNCDNSITVLERLVGSGKKKDLIPEEGCARKSTWPVCSKPDGSSEQGLCDMTGNVVEWVQDLARDHWRWEPKTRREEAHFVKGIGTGPARVVRGGSWKGAGSCTSADQASPVLPFDTIGFRPARALPR